MSTLARTNASRQKKDRNKGKLTLPSCLIFSGETDNTTSTLSAASETSSQVAAATFSTIIAGVGDDSLSPEVVAVGELKREDVEILQKLGEGSGGSVMKALHKPTGFLMAKKVFQILVTVLKG